MENNILKHRIAVVNNIAKSFGYESSSDSLEKSEENEIEKAKHQDGDIHPNGKWVWTKYLGKNGYTYDWREIKDKTIKIESVNYSPERASKPNSSEGWNTKVLYKYAGKTFIGHIWIDFFNEEVYGTKQPKEGKIIPGLIKEVIKFEIDKGEFNKRKK